MKRQLRQLLLAYLLLPVTALAAGPAHLLQDFATTRVIIDTSAISCRLFDVYVAQTVEQRAQGLMYVETMDLHEGMLFIYPQTTRIRMWMKNTLIPLDMLFVDEQLSIVHVHANAVPLSEDIIDSQQPVTAVIELNGGAAERFAIRPGDRVIVSEL